MNGGHLSLAGRALTLGMGEPNGLSVAAFSTEGIGGQVPVFGATLKWWPEEMPVHFTSGLVADRESLLGNKANGAFGRVVGFSAYVGVEGSARLGAGAEIGTVNGTVRGGMLTGLSQLTTSTFALQAVRTLNEGDSLVVSVAQPLRVETGRTGLSVPIGRTTQGQVLHGSLTADLEPTGHQTDLTAEWRRSLATGAELRLGAALTRQPGHDAQAGPDVRPVCDVALRLLKSGWSPGGCSENAQGRAACLRAGVPDVTTDLTDCQRLPNPALTALRTSAPVTSPASLPV